MIGGKTSGWGLGMRGKVALISTLGLGRFFFQKNKRKGIPAAGKYVFFDSSMWTCIHMHGERKKRGAPFFCSEDLRRRPHQKKTLSAEEHSRGSQACLFVMPGTLMTLSVICDSPTEPQSRICISSTCFNASDALTNHQAIHHIRVPAALEGR